MARLLLAVGEEHKAYPRNGLNFSLAEVQTIVQGWVEEHVIGEGRSMLMNEDGISLGLPPNRHATAVLADYYGIYREVMGDVLICEKEEWGDDSDSNTDS